MSCVRAATLHAEGPLDAIATETARVGIVLDLEDVPRDVRRVRGEERLEVVPIDRLAAVETILAADRRQPTQATETDAPDGWSPLATGPLRPQPAPRAIRQRALRDPAHAGVEHPYPTHSSSQRANAAPEKFGTSTRGRSNGSASAATGPQALPHATRNPAVRTRVTVSGS